LNSRSSCSLMISSDKGSRFGSVRTIDRISKSSIIRGRQTGSPVEFYSTILRLSPVFDEFGLGFWLLGAPAQEAPVPATSSLAQVPGGAARGALAVALIPLPARAGIY
jgi:hypothetical protein